MLLILFRSLSPKLMESDFSVRLGPSDKVFSSATANG
jgi:hypothetical protein